MSRYRQVRGICLGLASIAMLTYWAFWVVDPPLGASVAKMIFGD